MSRLVLISVAAQTSEYSEPHIRLLLRKGVIKGEKPNGIWLVDLDDLQAYEQKMKEAGTSKFDPTRKSLIDND